MTLNFQDGTFLGWVSDAGGPGTTAGLAPGMPRAALTAATFAETPLGPEFEADEVFGLLEGEKVARLWAGVACFFR